MRRFIGGTLIGATFALALAACKDTSGGLDCYESGATAYAFHAPGDTSVVFRWPGSYYPVRYYAEPTGELPANVDAGLLLWVNAFRCGELTLQRVNDSTIADVVIRNPSQMPPLPAAGAAFFADSVGACQGRTDVLVDSLNRLVRPIRSYVTPFSTDSVAVAGCYHFVTAHEIGHTLGLFSHSLDPADLMYGVPRRRVLSPNDRYTIQLLYHWPSITIPPEPR